MPEFCLDWRGARPQTGAMIPVLSATTTAAQLGIAQIADGALLLVQGGTARLILCEAGANDPISVTLGMAGDPQSGYFVMETPPAYGEEAAIQPGDAMALQVDDGQNRLFLFGNSGTLSSALIAADGSIGTAQAVSTNIGALTNVTSFTLIPGAAGDYAAVTRFAEAGLALYQVASSGALTRAATIADSAKSYVADVVDSASVLVGGRSILLTLSASENGLTSFEVTGGAAVLVDSLGNRDGLWISGAQALQTAQVAGQTYALIAAVTSDSLSVVRVNDLGCLIQTDHEIDSLATRFRGASALDTFEVNGRSFVALGGSDAGLTVFELLPGGSLGLMSSTAFETGPGLGNIAAIEAAVNGTQVAFFVTEESGARVQVFTADYSGLGGLYTAAGAPVIGSGLSDRLIGSAGADTLSGAGGSDILHDGAGADLLTGGAGADVFVLAADGSTDRISDFQDGSDRIQLDGWGRIYSASALTITQTATGARIAYGAQELLVDSAGGGPLAPSLFSDSDFLF